MDKAVYTCERSNMCYPLYFIHVIHRHISTLWSYVSPYPCWINLMFTNIKSKACVLHLFMSYVEYAWILVLWIFFGIYLSSYLEFFLCELSTCVPHPFFCCDGYLTDYYLCNVNVIYAIHFPICCLNFNFMPSLSIKVFFYAAFSNISFVISFLGVMCLLVEKI